MWHITQPAAALVPRAVVRKQVPDAEIAVYLAALARLEDPAVAGLIRVLEGMVPSTGALSTQLGLIASGSAPLASAMDMVDWDTFIPALTQALDANQLAAFQAGVAMAGQQAGIVMDVVPGAMQATIDSHAAQAALRGSGLVREITSDQRALINGIVTQGMTRQASVGTMARQLRGGIGLTQRQAGAVGNFGDALERYAAGDMSLDAVRSQYQLARGIRIPAKGLTPARINQLTQAYRDRWVKHRATTIARTETMHALHAGKMAQWDAMRKEGLLPSGLVLEWITTPDERTCQICMPAHGEQVQVGESFSTGVPRPPAHPMCRCDVRQVRGKPRQAPKPRTPTLLAPTVPRFRTAKDAETWASHNLVERPIGVEAQGVILEQHTPNVKFGRVSTAKAQSVVDEIAYMQAHGAPQIERLTIGPLPGGSRGKHVRDLLTGGHRITLSSTAKHETWDAVRGRYERALRTASGDRAARLSRALEYPRVHATETMANSASHEMGHVLHGMLDRTSPGFRAKWDAIIASVDPHAVSEYAHYIQVSEFGGHLNGAELFAESVTLYRKGYASELPAAIREILDEVL